MVDRWEDADWEGRETAPDYLSSNFVSDKIYQAKLLHKSDRTCAPVNNCTSTKPNTAYGSTLVDASCAKEEGLKMRHVAGRRISLECQWMDVTPCILALAQVVWVG